MKQQIIVSIPDATAISALPAEMLELLNLLGITSVPEWTMPGTRVVNDRRLVHLMSNASPSTIEWLLGMFNVTSGADWVVEAAQDWKLERDPETNEIVGGVYKPVPLSLLEYVADQYDEDGNALPRPTEPVALHTFSGAEPWVWG